jgi:hypothetical protein
MERIHAKESHDGNAMIIMQARPTARTAARSK